MVTYTISIYIIQFNRVDQPFALCSIFQWSFTNIFNTTTYIWCSIRPLGILTTMYRSHCVDSVALSTWKAFYTGVYYILKSSTYTSAKHVSSSSTMRMQRPRYGLVLCRSESSSPLEMCRKNLTAEIWL